MTGASPPPSGLPEEAFAAALTALPGMGPARLVALLQEDTPRSIWRRVGAGEILRPSRANPAVRAGRRVSWADSAAQRDVAALWRRLVAGAITVAYRGGPRFPEVLASDPEPPGVVFWVGDLEGRLVMPRVAIVGTRHCTGYGRTVAAELGRDLAASGICIVSGLALGIDGAAHEGALRADAGAGPLGVAASGVDTPYPSRHAGLWRDVVAAGAVLSETPPGHPAQAWRFPARNRLIAALAQAVVVVESHGGGGSMLTVAAAAQRGVEVLAVPGPVTSPSSAGTNQLLHEGVTPARHAGDVLAVLGDLRPWPDRPATDVHPRRSPAGGALPSAGGALPPAGGPSPAGGARLPATATGAGGRSPGGPPPTAPQPSDGRPRIGRSRSASDHGGRDNSGGQFDLATPADPAPHLDPAARLVLGAVDRTPTATSVVAERTGLPLGVLSVVLVKLESRGLVRGQGIWWERCDPR